MISGLYASASAMTIEEIKHDVIANNMANAGTVGFKRDNVSISSFDEALNSAVRKIGQSETLLQPPSSSTGIGNYTDFSQGSIRMTENSLDAAINGDGFFAIQTPEGIRYTRNGSFALNENNDLIMAGSPQHRVLGTGNTPITVPDSGGKISIDNKGNITIGDEAVGTLMVTAFEDNAMLVKTGGNLFIAQNEGSGTTAAEGSYTIAQSSLEMSNVNVIQEMVAMIINQRNYQLSQKMIQSQDQTIERAINDVGRT
jgi:flagellar basal-body rod protein FlgF